MVLRGREELHIGRIVPPARVERDDVIDLVSLRDTLHSMLTEVPLLRRLGTLDPSMAVPLNTTMDVRRRGIFPRCAFPCYRLAAFRGIATSFIVATGLGALGIPALVAATMPTLRMPP